MARRSRVRGNGHKVSRFSACIRGSVIWLDGREIVGARWKTRCVIFRSEMGIFQDPLPVASSVLLSRHADQRGVSRSPLAV
jgi:hypothetical protein